MESKQLCLHLVEYIGGGKALESPSVTHCYPFESTVLGIQNRTMCLATPFGWAVPGRERGLNIYILDNESGAKQYTSEMRAVDATELNQD